MKKIVTATIATLSLGAVGIAQSDAEASENNQSGTQYSSNQSTNGMFEYGYIDKDNSGNYHHTLDGNWDQSMFDQHQYYFYLIDEEGNYHYYYFPMNDQGANSTNTNATNAYNDNNYSADKSHEAVQKSSYDVNEAPAQSQETPQSSNNEVSAQTSSQEQSTTTNDNASNNNATYTQNNTSSNGNYDSSYTRNDGNGIEDVKQNATSNNVENTINEPTTEPTNTNSSNEVQVTQQEAASSSEASSNNTTTNNNTSSNNNSSTNSSNWLTSNSQLQPYGQYHGGGAHYGVDYAMDENTPVYSLADGTVVQSGWSNYGGGNQVTIQEQNSDNYQWYMHMNSLNVQKGDQVKEGQQIGESGSTGNSTAPHLHFQRMEGGIGNGYSVDPTSYVNSKA
ncbi:M23 family metallopeptidase [Staphylococcus sp. NAM3COL9]|uniref:M23 family metallopeptidase n=1 Tax=Staphylococcus sp. NAM3COL9 TaxID=1667172 RepID=UPI00070B6412|nr:M23 family metallopeptidase [Staphylococcus sp. NAM3COL9]KRG08521.1 peptidase M23 [Staphylococcus sp. NAM3COL9]